MAEESQYPFEYQFLGDCGSTQRCVKAMIAILTGPYRPSAVTVVFREMKQDDTTTDVGFVVWDWITQATVIADGFGTHHGEGGRGFATICDMVQFYEIPLQEIWLKDDQYERIVFGHPTNEDLEYVRHHADPADAYNLLTLSQFRRQLWHERMPGFHTPVPYWMIEPELREDLKDIERNPDLAVFQVARRLEVIIREVCQLPAMVTGELLIHAALGGNKPLEPKGATTHEAESWVHLFQGIIGAFKEPHSHRDHPLKREDAIAQILAINLLLRKLKQDHPEQFQKTDHDGNWGRKEGR
jgi:hypothetical protein